MNRGVVKSFPIHANRAGILLLGLLCLSGCQSTQFKVGDETFTSKEAALQRMDQINNDTLASIAATRSPVHGTALVVVPTADEIRQKGIKWSGNLSRTNTRFVQDMNDYLSAATAKNLEFMFKAIERRQIFDRVSFAQGAEPENYPAATADFVVYYLLVSPDAAQWYLKGKMMSQPRPLFLDAGKKPGAPRTLAWLDFLEETARAASAK